MRQAHYLIRVGMFTLSLLLLSGLFAAATPRSSDAAPLALSSITEGTNGIAINPAKVAKYAVIYTTPPNQFTNMGGCYYDTNGQCTEVTPENPEIPPGTRIVRTADAAHFVACAIEYALEGRPLPEELAGERFCAQQSGGSVIHSTLLSNDALYAALAGYVTRIENPGPTTIQPGDLVVFECRPAIVISVNPNASSLDTGVRLAAHSTSGPMWPYEARCAVDGERVFGTYYRLNADTDQPDFALDPLDQPYNGAPLELSWRETAPGQDDLRRFEIYADSDTSPIVTATAAERNTTVELGMCSATTLRLVAIDHAGNRGESSHRFRIFQPGDFDGNGAVDTTDQAALESRFAAAPTGTDAPFDLTGDGLIDAADRLLLLSFMGETCPVTRQS